jgi:phosphotransferase system enzyme I (PtsP)
MDEPPTSAPPTDDPSDEHVGARVEADSRLSRVQRLARESFRTASLRDVLQGMATELVELAAVDVVSLYVRETEGSGDWLVLRSNVGFPVDALGEVRLRIGEGLTGLAAECMLPVQVARAGEERGYRHVTGLGEERFPVFLALPLGARERLLGVLVLQRREREFGPEEVAFASAVATIFAHAIDRHGDEAPQSARRARLHGTPVSPGLALGRAEVFRSVSAEGEGEGGERIPEAFDAVAEGLEQAYRSVESRLSPDRRDEVQAAMLVLHDSRLRKRAVECGEKLGLWPGLSQVAHDYAVAALDAEPDMSAWMESRSLEVEDLCALIGATVLGERSGGNGGALLLPDHLSTCVALACVARRAAALVVAGHVDPTSAPAQVARAGRLPVIGDVKGLYSWTRPGDRLLIDGGRGTVQVNPAATTVARARRRRRRRHTTRYRPRGR